jgi:hypothetical protein
MLGYGNEIPLQIRALVVRAPVAGCLPKGGQVGESLSLAAGFLISKRFAASKSRYINQYGAHIRMHRVQAFF